MTLTALLAATLMHCGRGEAPPPEVKRTSYFKVVGIWEAPGRGLADLTFARGAAWLADEDRAGLIYKLNPANGSVLSSVGTSYGPPSAICFDGVYFYVAAADTGDVYRHAATPRMEELARFPTGLAQIRGMFYDGGTFYVFDQATRTVWEFNDAWERGRSWRVGDGDERIRGFATFNGRVWSADWLGGWLNLHKQGNFDIEGKYCSPGWHPAGLAWDGAYLFLGDTGGRVVYKLDMSRAP